MDLHNSWQGRARVHYQTERSDLCGLPYRKFNTSARFLFAGGEPKFNSSGIAGSARHRLPNRERRTVNRSARPRSTQFAGAAILREKPVRAVKALPGMKIEADDRSLEEGLAVSTRRTRGVAALAGWVRE